MSKLDELVTLLVQIIDERIAAANRAAVDTVDLIDLGALAIPKRQAYRAAREGRIRGVKKIGRRWYARKRDFDRWIDEYAVAPPRRDEPTVEKDLRDLGLGNVLDRRKGVDALYERLGLVKIDPFEEWRARMKKRLAGTELEHEGALSWEARGSLGLLPKGWGPADAPPIWHEANRGAGIEAERRRKVEEGREARRKTCVYGCGRTVAHNVRGEPRPHKCKGGIDSRALTRR